MVLAYRSATLHGIWVVYRSRLRAWSAVATALSAVGIVVLLFVATLALGALVFGRIPDLLESGPMGWVLVEPAAATIALMIAAALAGAAAAVTAEEARSLLVTSLRPLDICVGNLTAGLTPVLVALAVDFMVWMLIVVFGQRAWPPAHLRAASVVSAHFVQLCAIALVATVAMLSSQTSASRKASLRGAVMGLLVIAACVGEVFVVNQPVSSAQAMWLLAPNPVAATASAVGQDILRAPWIYDHTVLVQYDYTYPAPGITAALFALATLAALAASAERLRRACQ